MSQETQELPMWVAFEKPKDFPDKYVLRKFLYDKPTNEFELYESIEEFREKYKEMYWIPRLPEDDPVVMGVYV